MIAGGVLAALALSAAGAVEVQAVRDGRPVELPDREALAQALVALVESSSVNSTDYVRPAAGWPKALAAPSRVWARFAAPREVRVMDAKNRDWRRRAVHEILLVLPADGWPDHVLLKVDGGVVSVTKYSPCALLHVVDAAAWPVFSRYDVVREGCPPRSRPRVPER